VSRLPLVIVALTLACPPIASSAAGDDSFTSEDVWIDSRDATIPVTFVTPSLDDPRPVPLAILIHGHGGTRHEAGGFTRVADELARQGIASIRMDFPGCGDSKESFARNNLTNMLADVRAAHAYALANANIDTARVGLLGFSMGGRIAMALTAQDQRFRAMALWAPSGMNGIDNMANYLGGAEVYVRKRAQAKAEGWAPFTTFWGQDQQLGYQWFTDLEASRPADDVARFRGALFVLYGDKDDVVAPEISRSVLDNAVNASSREQHIVPGADHGLGLFNDDWASSEDAVRSTVAFFLSNL